MIHHFRLWNSYLPRKYTIGCYVLKSAITWKDEDQVIEVELKSASDKRKCEELLLLKGAFWNDDYFQRGEDVLVFMNRNHITNKEGHAEVCFIASQEFFYQFIGQDSMEDFDRMKKILLLPPEMCQMAFTYISGQRIEKDKDNVSNFLDITHKNDYFEIIEPYMLPEQRVAYKKWNAYPESKNKDAEKVKYLLSVCPNAAFRDKYVVTYDTIMKTLDEYIVGNEEIKKTLAMCLSRNYIKKNNRGIKILIHGLPGTGKTQFGKAIAESLHLKSVTINLGNKGSTVSLFGSESHYADSEPGRLLKFFSCHSAESVVILDEIEKMPKIGSSRGKDGHVAEGILSLLDDRKVLEDAFIDEVPISVANTIFVCTANRLDALDAEILSRMDYVFKIDEYDATTLIEILKIKMPKIEEEYGIAPGWVDDNGLMALLKYRSDFGARDAISNLKFLAAHISANNKKVITESAVDEIMLSIVDLDNPSIRFHYNEYRYPADQKEAILDAMSRRMTASNMDAQEIRALDMKIDYLTRLLPETYNFDPTVFFEVADKKLFGMRTVKNNIASELYAESKVKHHPQPLLLLGPAGVGKTSLCEAIAEATGKQLVKIDMAGTTNIDAFQGQAAEKVAANAGIPIREMAKRKTSSPCLYLDEIDKICGCESERALFEMLDDQPHLYDKFLDYSLDLSNTEIICSANDISQLHPALLSRLKIIECKGYSVKEKNIIAKEYLWPELTKNVDVKIDDEAFNEILKHSEAECGIRSLKHNLGSVIKRSMLDQRHHPIVRICKADVEKILGKRPFMYMAENSPGCVNALGVIGNSRGIVLPIRVTLLKSKEKRITGLLQEEVRDSILITESWLEKRFGLVVDGYHLHVAPSIKKKGPSMGVSVAIAMLSALLNVPVSGEIAFSGEFDGSFIYPIGGLEAKINAAVSTGIKRVYLPEGCKGDVSNDDYEGIELVFVKKIEDILGDLFPDLNEKVRENKYVRGAET